MVKEGVKLRRDGLQGGKFRFPWRPFLAFLSSLDFLFHFVYYPLEIVALQTSLNLNPKGVLWPLENETPFVAY